MYVSKYLNIHTVIQEIAIIGFNESRSGRISIIK